jgi:hypothetical protein
MFGKSEISSYICCSQHNDVDVVLYLWACIGIDWYVNTIITSREMILSLNIVSKPKRRNFR